MRKILIFMGRYLPGHKDGGPLRTIVNLTEALGDEYSFYIAAFDRDHEDTHPYPGISHNAWNTVGKAKVWYVRPGGFTFSLLRKLARNVDMVYTCGFYNAYGYQSLILNKLGLLYGKPIAVASMGTFSEGALMQKSAKKRLFINGLKKLGLFRNICWSVTSELEAEDVKRVIGEEIRYVVAEDLPRTSVPGRLPDKSFSLPLKLAFLSRISPKKNLLGAVQALQLVSGEVQFHIYGPKEDPSYWDQCEHELNKLPAHVQWKYHGDVPSEQVQNVLQENDAFFLPTLGENYGHVIFEALSAGCIPIISDQTPWNVIRDAGAGFIIPVQDINGFAQCIDRLIAMEPEKKIELSDHAIAVAEEKVRQAQEGTGYRKIFSEGIKK